MQCHFPPSPFLHPLCYSPYNLQHLSQGLLHSFLPCLLSSSLSALCLHTITDGIPLLPSKAPTPLPGTYAFQSSVSSLSSLILYNTYILATLVAQQTTPLCKHAVCVLFLSHLFSCYCFFLLSILFQLNIPNPICKLWMALPHIVSTYSYNINI